MVKIRWGFTSGITAFALALLTSLLFGQTGFGTALLRAAVFAGVFFGLGLAARMLIGNFIPDLLYSGEKKGNAANSVFSAESTGSRVDITVGDSTNAALPEDDENNANSGEVGNFNDLVARSIKSAAHSVAHSPVDFAEDSAVQDIDQNDETGYTNDKVEEIAPVFDKVKFDDIGDFSMDFGAFVSDDYGSGGRESLDSDMESFSSLLPDSDDSGASRNAAEPERKASGNKPMKLEGDFDPKEIAAGIRTVLKKEKG
jgi:hypothetical protein